MQAVWLSPTDSKSCPAHELRGTLLSPEVKSSAGAVTGAPRRNIDGGGGGGGMRHVVRRGITCLDQSDLAQTNCAFGAEGDNCSTFTKTGHISFTWVEDAPGTVQPVGTRTDRCPTTCSVHEAKRVKA